MIAVDTNVIVRLLVNDDAKQAARARKVFEGGDIAITSGVLIETVWVLSRTYALDRSTIGRSLLALLALPNIVVPWPDSAQALIDAFLAGLDFADFAHMLDAKLLGCRQLVSFDQRFRRRMARRSIGIEVVSP